jgi:DNA-binding MarR family transcriptional regulator
MTSREPLPFDPIMRAATLWERRIGPSRTMAAVTSVMRVQQILLSAVDGALRPHGLTFARYEALVLLTFARSGRLPMRMMGERLQLHPTSVTNIVDRLQADGLVRRMPHPTDRRATLVEITEAGSTAGSHGIRHNDRLRSGRLEPDRAKLTDLLRTVRRAAGDFS